MREGYSLSKTLRFETSGGPIRLNLFHEKYFLLEGVSQGSGIYHCIIVYSMEDG